ncbi:glycine zipper 2TM domain-containing protein [Candidatus Competibacter phosphatis]|uniref:Glycine zipper 2TM domain-containing protein n=1 Tax=Candidatus Competibacter phosphatis TaxID=221280 RepID=A0ABX1TL43_9GAMM|nr:glycine zipper domain-containing protein [Candidatus Competibacter phosphatis]NMQ19426.1 glycine zipper 2TM domain-containing protein [Candidatus Competibacter phosphatis]
MHVHHSGTKWLVAVAIGATLSGCATNPDGTTNTNDQQATVAQGAVFGALVGGLLGAAVSGDNRGRGALIGAAAGGLIGAGIGSSIAERKAQYANEEDFLVAEIRRNQEFIQEADAQNRQLYQEIAQLDRESQRLARQYRAGKASRDALVQQKATVEKQLAKAKQINSLAEKQLADAEQVHQESQQKRGPQDQYTRQLESNLVELKETRQKSSQNVASLQRVYDSMSI